MGPTPYVAVIGPSEAEPEIYDLALQVGGLLAGRDAVVVCGGLGGVMEAAARGAAEHGGTSLGILPGPDRLAANRYLTMAVATGMGELRNGLVVRASDAVIAVGASWGTLSELSLAVRTGGPVVAVRGWSVVDAAGVEVTGVLLATSAEEAVDLALEVRP